MFRRRLVDPVRAVQACVLLLTMPLGVTRAQSTTSAPARDSVLTVVNRFFFAMETRDTAALREMLLTDGHTVAISMRGDSTSVGTRPNGDFMGFVARRSTRLRERIWEPVVLQRSAMALVWAPYDFYLDHTFSHCGVDSFTLARTGNGWRIIDIAFTIEPTGCAPSPLGPRPE